MVALLPSSSPTTIVHTHPPSSPLQQTAASQKSPVLSSKKQQPNRQQRPRRRRRRSERCVEFVPDHSNTIWEIPGRDTLSAEMMQQLYISTSEQRRIHQEILQLVRDLRLERRHVKSTSNTHYNNHHSNPHNKYSRWSLTTPTTASNNNNDHNTSVFSATSSMYTTMGGDVVALRGLEALTNLQEDDRRPRVKKAISIVIQRQWDGPIDEQWLSTVYRPLSRAAMTWALQRAERDHVEAYSDAPKRIIMAR